MRNLIILMLLVLSSLLSYAKATADKTFNASPDKVYLAVQKVIREHYVQTFVDDKQMLVSFKTPSSNWSGGLFGNAFVELDQGKSILHITLQDAEYRSSHGNNNKVEKDIFQWVEKELDK